MAALVYTQVAHIPIEQILNGAIAAVLFNIIYDLVLSSKLRWYALASVIDSINHSSFSQVSLPTCRSECRNWSEASRVWHSHACWAQPQHHAGAALEA